MLSSDRPELGSAKVESCTHNAPGMQPVVREAGRHTQAAPDHYYRLLLAGCLVCAANLPRFLPNATDLLHREKAGQFDVLNGPG
jgi:hypothetical protein